MVDSLVLVCDSRRGAHLGAVQGDRPFPPRELGFDIQSLPSSSSIRLSNYLEVVLWLFPMMLGLYTGNTRSGFARVLRRAVAKPADLQPHPEFGSHIYRAEQECGDASNILPLPTSHLHQLNNNDQGLQLHRY